jgi:hypothetical protein
MPVGKEETIAVKAFQYSKTISGLVVHLDVIPRLEYFLMFFPNGSERKWTIAISGSTTATTLCNDRTHRCRNTGHDRNR